MHVSCAACVIYCLPSCLGPYQLIDFSRILITLLNVYTVSGIKLYITFKYIKYIAKLKLARRIQLSSHLFEAMIQYNLPYHGWHLYIAVLIYMGYGG